ncbi:MAG: Gfo/Idh/MocA family oxidoreductase, partial [bacterium]|nr:Gfo/Idh/MocA family oxidoreductase [bacterium]
IGCGGRGNSAVRDAIRAYEGIRLVAMADVFDEHIQAQRAQLKAELPEYIQVDDDHCFAGLDGYKRLLETDVDVVLIACASLFHPRYSHAAIEAGKHVFVEKPHGIDPAGARLMSLACEFAKLKNLCLVSGLMNRYVPEVQETMKRVHDGAIGDIIAIEENYLRAPYALVARRETDTEMEYQFRNWYHFSWLSGDDVIQTLVHSVDKALWAMGDQMPVKAHGLAGRSASFGEIYGDVFDHHTVAFEYENGVRIYAMCRTQHDCHEGVSDIILGTKGRCDLLANRITGETNWQYEGDHGSGYIEEHKALYKAILAGESLVNDYMATSTMAVILGQMACYSGKQITWKDAWASSFTFGPQEASFEMEPPKVPGPDGNYPIAVPGKTQVL